MKTKIIIEIQTPDANSKIGRSIMEMDEDMTEPKKCSKAKEKQFQKDWAVDLHREVVYAIKNHLEIDDDSDWLLDMIDESCIEGWDSLKEYGVKISIKEVDA